MKSKWSDEEASGFRNRYAKRWGEDLALRAYSSRLIGGEKELVLHGGGNTSVKSTFTNVLGEIVPAIYVKASGYDLAVAEPEGHSGLDLEVLRRLRELAELGDDAMAKELRAKLLDPQSAAPSIEALLHVFISAKFVDHTHADAILALTNQQGGAEHVRRALGDNVIVVDYVKPGFALAKAASMAFERAPRSEGMVLLKHGLVTWGESGRESYERTIAIVSRAEDYLWDKINRRAGAEAETDPITARQRYNAVAPVLRGLLAVATNDPDRPYDRFILRPLITDEVLALVDSADGKAVALTPPLTADHLIRTKAFPMWIDDPSYDDEEKLRGQIARAMGDYARRYEEYLGRHSHRLAAGIEPFDSKPRVILMPGLGAVCSGADVREAGIVRDIAARTLSVKAKIAAMGVYEGLSEEHLFDMEYFSLQHAKLGKETAQPLRRSVALVTGAAGAIGAGICAELLRAGCHVALSDLHGDPLTSLALECKRVYGDRVFAVPLDVTDAASVREGFRRVVQGWGGIDLVVANAGIAHVAPLTDLDAEAFRRLERVNIEGTLNVLAESGRHFKQQGTGGDIVVISTKNVFAPGAKFGAYSATKAAAHQLARIASLELADIDVRVNMVSPDAVFSHGDRRSGLWAEIGPDRMKARGLDEKGLEEYYRNRNLLKVRVSAVHVARAVVFFATRQTPTTGATIPVDGGLPDATPR
jgi:rhamnose utilization protein RhaD (predicted bifunctional aldolase and dehydrogenase)/NAD(P)-dependent dehydrogenase (short-subunit alcohol dehydrogenase family)